MEIKWNIAKWLRNRKARKLAEENAYRDRQRPIYRGQALRIQGRVEDGEDMEKT